MFRLLNIWYIPFVCTKWKKKDLELCTSRHWSGVQTADPEGRTKSRRSLCCNLLLPFLWRKNELSLPMSVMHSSVYIFLCYPSTNRNTVFTSTPSPSYLYLLHSLHWCVPLVLSEETSSTVESSLNLLYFLTRYSTGLLSWEISPRRTQFRDSHLWRVTQIPFRTNLVTLGPLLSFHYCGLSESVHYVP